MNVLRSRQTISIRSPISIGVLIVVGSLQSEVSGNRVDMFLGKQTSKQVDTIDKVSIIDQFC